MMRAFRRIVFAAGTGAFAATLALMLFAALALTNIGTAPVLASLDPGDAKIDNKCDNKCGWKDAERDCGDKGASGFGRH